jgi:hypothetical protein
MPTNDITVWCPNREGIMLGELLVWLGVVMAAFVAWALYNTTDSVPQDQDPPRRQDD